MLSVSRDSGARFDYANQGVDRFNNRSRFAKVDSFHLGGDQHPSRRREPRRTGVRVREFCVTRLRKVLHGAAKDATGVLLSR